MSSGFVTESEAAEARQRRQEEWEKVRTPDQPLERPEEPYDGRSLYDRLKEQKMKKDLEYEEAHKLKNLIRGLDDDEVQFLELVDQTKIDAERKQIKEDAEELKDFRSRVACLQQESEDKKIQAELTRPKAKTNSTMSTTRKSQKDLLGVGIKRKNGETNDANSGSCSVAKTSKTKAVDNAKPTTEHEEVKSITTNEYDRGQLKCTAILPGIGPYTASSDSEISSGSDDEPDTQSKYDLCGRKIKKKRRCEDE